MASTIIDDQDLSQVTYVGGWVRGGTTKEYKGTVASSTKAGDCFTVKFEGTSISVYGTLDSTSGGVVTNYAIDGAPAAQVTSNAGSGDTYDQLFWASPTVGSGNHQLLVTMVQLKPNSQPGEGTIWFDYFNVTKGPISPSPSPNSVTKPATAHKKSNKFGPIVGVVAGIIILIALVLLLLFYRRRRRLSKDVKPKVILEPPVAPAYPYPVEQNSTHHASTDQFLVTRNVSQGPNGYSVTLVPPPPLDYTTGNSGSQFSPTSSSSAFTSHGKFSSRSGNMYSVNPDHDALLDENRKALEKSNEARKYASSSAEPLQHADSGIRAIDPDSIPPGGRVELPPAYTAA